MSVKVGYRGEQLMMSAARCACGAHHNAITQNIFVGAGLISRLPDLIRSRELGEVCVLVADLSTYEAAGRAASAALKSAGYEVSECVFEREGALVPDERALGELLMAMSMRTEFFIAVGAGTVTDITRIVAAQTERPFVSVPTAPSTSNYMGLSAHLMYKGRCARMDAICPELVACDMDVIARAPSPLFQAGVMDMVAKYVARADWFAADRSYCADLAQVTFGAANKVLKHASEIADRSQAGAQVLMESLLLCGMASVVLGGPRPVSGSERWIADEWMNAGVSPGVSRGLLLGAAALALMEGAQGGELAAMMPEPERVRLAVAPLGPIPNLPDGLIPAARRSASMGAGDERSLLAMAR